MLSPKERQIRGIDVLGRAVGALVDVRMQEAAQGRPWLPLYEAAESARLGRPVRASLDDPRLVLRILRHERGVFTEVDATQRAWLDELVQATNRAAHATSLEEWQVDRALDTMILLAQSLDLDGVVADLTTLRVLGRAGGTTTEAAYEAEIDVGEADVGEADAGEAGTAGGPEDRTEAGAPTPSAAHAPRPAERLPMADLPRGAVALSARVGGLEVAARIHEALNYALVHNGVSPVIGLSVRNRAGTVARDVTVTFALALPDGAASSPVAVPLAVHLGDLGPGEVVDAPLAALSWRSSPVPFLEVDEAVDATASLEVEREGIVHRDETTVRVPPADQWWPGSSADSLAAFVRPNEQAIVDLLAEVSSRLDRESGDPSLQGYQAGPERAHLIAQTVYDALAALEITYVEPPASFEGAGQRIRSHREVLERRIGTCLDLACTYAAALEQAGLAPVLVLARGHAFCGYLTEDAQLPETLVSERGAIITIAESDSFEAVETTAVCAGDDQRRFDEARAAVQPWWRARLAEIAALIDVRAAHRWVKPLPTLRREGDVRVVETVREVPVVPARRAPVATGAHRPVESTPARVARWKRSLLDMSYANPLLRLKAASTTTLHVPAEALGVLEDLVADGTSLELLPNDVVAQVHELHGARTAADVDAATLRDELRAGHRLFAALGTAEFPRRLTALRRRSVTAREETGTDTLYLALGTLRWTEHRREGHAPLFLVPVKLVGGRGGSRFWLQRDETREVEPNYCLHEKLRVSFDLDLPELVDPGQDESGIDLDGALRRIRSQLLTKKAMTVHVEETAHLATFQFSTLGMWRDLDQHWADLVRRPAVQHLVESAGRPFLDGIEPPPRDDRAEATTYLPIPADGSQIRAVRWAAAGKSFILEGPPGTGKSQTITNLIAHCLAEGRSVLFVAEKQAALEVVQRRLDDVGLGPFSLDVHGATQTVSAVREQLREALERAEEPDASWESLRAGYRNVVESLSHYPRHLHEPGPAGLSAWDARQIVLEIADTVPDGVPAVPVPRALVMGERPLEEIYELAHDLGDALLALGVAPADSPWRVAGPLPEHASLDRQAVAAAASALESAEQGIGDPAVNRLVAGAETPAEIGILADWLDAAAAGVARSPSDARRLVTPPWRRRAQEVRDAVEHCRRTFGGAVEGFAPEVLDRELDALLARAEAADRKFFGKAKARRAVLAELAPYVREAVVDPARTTAVLRGLVATRHDVAQLVPFVRDLPGVDVPTHVNPFRDDDVRRLHQQLLGWEVSAALADGHGDLDEAEADAAEVLRRGGPGGEAVRAFERARGALLDVLRTTPEDRDGWSRGGTWAQARARTALQWRADAGGNAFVALDRWVRVRTALERLRAAGLTELVGLVLEGRLRGSEVEASVRLAVARELLGERLETTNLAGFDPRHHAALVDRFIATGADVRERLRRELPARIVAARTFDATQQRGDVGELRQQITRRRGGLSIRRLMQRFAPIMMQVTPCFLMSPASVAKFLPAGSLEFDVVVFDEASQIRVPEAIGAMGRGRAVVVVGDSQQMPPSAMFAASGANEDEEDAAEEDLPVPVDMDSILTEAVEANLPRLLLSWHYRSRDETLIAFSNQHYYEGRLASFPTPPHEGGVSAVHLRRVDGAWEGGGRSAARVNRAEADAVVAEVRALLREDAGRSIGVVTFNTQQRELILDLLEQQAERDGLLAAALDRPEEPLFVKNLENVQGDERDVVLFTLAFAKDGRGKVPLNWGPLTRVGGEKRLNVAVTRAKEKVVVFASFDPHELDLATTRSVGLARLKDYLLLARDGVQHALTRRTLPRDRHLQEVRHRLEDAGLEIRAAVGLSDFTVDLAVRADAAAPWLAVLLDGPRWAARESVGDRDGLPRAVLTERMGWSGVERIWLAEWVRDADAVVDGVRRAAVALAERAAAEAARAGAELAGDEGSSSEGEGSLSQDGGSPLEDGGPSLEDGGSSLEDGGPSLEHGLPSPDPSPRAFHPEATTAVDPAPPVDREPVPVRRQDAPGPGSSTAAGPKPDPGPKPEPGPRGTPFVAAPVDVRHARELLDETSQRAAAAIRAELTDVIEAEGPVLRTRLARVVARRFDLGRLRGTREEQILGFLPPGSVRQSANGDAVAWPAAVDPSGYRGFRVPGDARDPTDVPYEELRNGMVSVVRDAFAMAEGEVLKETARVFGWVRLGSNVRDRLADVLHAAIREGHLVNEESRVRAGGVG